MQLGMIGLGRMGSNMVRRLMRGGHECVVFDRDYASVNQISAEGAHGVASLGDLVRQLKPPRAVWMMVPAGAVNETVRELAGQLQPDDIVIDGGNSYYIDDIRRSKELAPKGIDYLDVGVSGGVWGLERGYCLMIGGPRKAADRLAPIFQTLAPGRGSIGRTPGREKVTDGSTAEEGFTYCGPNGAGHFVKMVHNGIEYGVMASIAEGLNVLKHANVGKADRLVDAETTPLRNPENYQYDFNLADITEVWRRGSVIASWLLDLTAAALVENPDLENFSGHVSDSGEGRWTLKAAIDSAVPAPVLSAAVYERFSSRDEAEFANRVLSAMRLQFGGHHERSAGSK
ncbi:MAG: decarboxylating 6-phosphogluconate dehydrogenase [Bryobacterales bacterium]|nr:decarboxylating 6-phosphogluconate dehydrogenase [Bryobacterales bacterium]